MGFESNSDLSSDENFLNQVRNVLPKINVEKKTHKCDFLNCNKVFSRPSKLRRHQCIHTQEKGFACTYTNCTKRYSYEWHLRRHIHTTHEKTLFRQTYKCVFEGCSKELSSDFALRRHIKHIHSDNSLKQYACDKCSLKFRKKSQLAAHLIIHTGNQKLICNKCSLTFQHIISYKKHVSNHKTYSCDCGEIFHRWSQYLSHKRTQHISTYNCDICSKVFRTKKYLKMHKQIHDDVRTAYECTYSGCPRYYYYSKNLMQHIKSFHEGVRFACTFNDCSRSFVNNQKLKEHMKVHDPNWVRKKTRQKKRKQRKDAGTTKKEMAAHLSGYLFGANIKKEDYIEIKSDEEDLVSSEMLKPSGCSGILNIIAKNSNLSNVVTC